MVDLLTFKNQVALVVNNLARAVVAEIFTAAEKLSLKEQNPETEEKLGALVESLCVDAVEKILKIVEPTKPDEDQCDGSGGGEDGGDGGDGAPPAEPTYILMYESAAADSRCLLPSTANNANSASGEHKGLSGEETALHGSSPPAPPQADDHEYARPPSLSPPGAAASRTGRVGRRRKDGARAAAEILLPCSRCGMMFLNAERLADHDRKSHPVCSACGAMFSGILKLRQHEMKEHGLLPYACDYCPKRFNHKAHRDIHAKARHTGEKPFHCDMCGKCYSSVSVLKTHRTTHFQKTFICDVCGKSFYHACHLNRHKLVHQEVRPYHCSTCGKGFTQATNLRSHQLIHSGERQLCSICGKSFRYLKNHVISKHSHELPADQLPSTGSIVSCDVCGKKFPNSSQHRVHQRSHTGEKPFHCDICGKSYRLKDLLRDHRYTHTGEKPYRCSLCSKTFNLATSFMRHRSIHTGETPYSCHDCGKHFRLLTFLKAHLQTKAHRKQTQQKEAAASHL
ncbi:zinc finger protein 79-like isoform X1 [Mugil cephalus]|uniref:zinc finger protein 79-like isoform X1 n=2 Tax=Mugil cephalus TaxID=48193 RepID=UPI001FB78C9E|nr:zinc finger protein 79-like isoform X1 [Mugil cephalus]